MTNDPQRRRRFAASYALSLILHGCAALLFAIVAIDFDTGSTEVAGPNDVVLVHADAPAEPHAAPVVSPLPTLDRPAVSSSSRPSSAPAVVRTPGVVETPSVVRRSAARTPAAPAAARPAVHARPPKPVLPPPKPELARNVEGAEPQVRVQATREPLMIQMTPVPAPSEAAIPILPATPAAVASPASASRPDPNAVAVVSPEPRAAATPEPFASPLPPPALPIRAPTAAPTTAPSAAAAIPPVSAQTVAPTSAPTARPTLVPTAEPTLAPTAMPTVAPTAAPTLAPTQASTAAHTPTPTREPVAAVREPSTAPSRAPQSPAAVATLAPTTAPPREPAGGPTLPPTPVPGPPPGAIAATASASPPAASKRAARQDAAAPPGASHSAAGGSSERLPAVGSPSGSASQPPVAGGPRGTSASPAAPATSAALGTLNDRLKALNTGRDVDYTPKRVGIGDAQSVIDRALAAYEAGLAPPPDILRRTFGFMYERRSARQPDSIAYVFDTYSIGPITMCKAWKIVEHPDQPIHEVGPVAGSAGIGGGVTTAANSAVVRHDNGGRAEASVVQFPCTPKSYTAVPAGSLTSPLPRHPDVSPEPSPSPSLAP